jgi:hypothetical protein
MKKIDVHVYVLLNENRLKQLTKEVLRIVILCLQNISQICVL